MNDELKSTKDSMNNKSELFYDWKRFCSLREGIIHLDNQGFLHDPDSKYGNIYNPDLVSIDKLIDMQCFILIGEPGIGKTTVFGEESKNTKDKIDKKDDVLCLDMGSYHDQTSLKRGIFENQKFISWKNSENNLYLFLDSLEECKLNINNLSKILVSEFKKYPIERLFLRIACRTADWPISLENGLNHIWGKNTNKNVGVYELAPLRYIDVEEASKANGLNFNEFLLELKNKDAVPFAIKPITLKLLINIYKNRNELFSTKEELYLKGCETLCSEINEEKKDISFSHEITSKKCLNVASNIAASIIFSNKEAIHTKNDLGDVSDNNISIDEFTFDNEIATNIPLDERVIKNTLKSGLFSSRGKNSMGFSHRTYAEFLAAYYLKENLELDQVMNLLIHPYMDNKIIAQFKEVAAWLAGMRIDFFQKMIVINPEILLLVDMKLVSDKEKSKLIDHLLISFNNHKLAYEYGLTTNYSKLNHPNLDNQILNYLGKQFTNITRENAIRIFEECNLKKQNDLEITNTFDEQKSFKNVDSKVLNLIVNIILDEKEDMHLRTTAMHAISNIGDDKSINLIKPFTKGVDEDYQDELKGYSLKAAWPDYMTVTELFDVLTPPKRNNFLGGYVTFISNDLLPHIKQKDIKIALKWIVEFHEKYGGKNINVHLRNLMDNIINQSFKIISTFEILDFFTEIIIFQIKKRDYYNNNELLSKLKIFLKEEKEKRREFLEILVSKISNPDELVDFFLFQPLILEEDVPWMLKKFEKADDKTKLKWVKLISHKFAFYKSEHKRAFKMVINKLNNIPPDFEYINNQINSYYIQRLKNDFNTCKLAIKKSYNLLKRDFNKKIKNFSSKNNINKLLDEFEKENLDKLIEIDIELHNTSKNKKISFKPNFTKSDGWNNFLNEKEKLRLLEAMKKFIEKVDPATDEWLNTKNISAKAIMGYKSVYTLYLEDKEYIIGINNSLWKTWAPVILMYPLELPSENLNIKKELLKLAYHYSPDEIIDTIKILFYNLSENEHFFILEIIEDIFDEKLETILIDIIKQNNLNNNQMEELLKFLIKRESKNALTLAETFIKNYSSNNGPKAKAISAAIAMVSNVTSSSWSLIWPLIEKDTEFGEKILHSFKFSLFTNENLFDNLTEDQLADFYIWLDNNYPSEEDPEWDDAHFVSSREEIGILRDSCINYLQNKGTDMACKAIEKIMNKLPDEWIKQTLIKAKMITRDKKWEPFNPIDIIKISNDNKYRLVQSGNQLQDVVIESLKRLQSKLHGENLPAQFLWNVCKEKSNSKRYFPKDENSFSDYVKIYLEEDIQKKGIILNREVEVHKKFTDIHIDAISKENNTNYKGIKLVIEVKGCWNPEVNKAMENQLLNQYLVDGCDHGIYLVGWFNCNKWDETDYKKNKAIQLVGTDIIAFKNRLNSQANELSDEKILKSFVMDLTLNN